MSRTVFCRKYQQNMEGLDLAPMPGARGQELLANVSKQAWQEWLKHQTMLINEKRLNMMDPAARSYLQVQMDRFLSNEDVDAADGYVPEKNNEDNV